MEVREQNIRRPGGTEGTEGTTGTGDMEDRTQGIERENTESGCWIVREHMPLRASQNLIVWS